jgi:hypothetical protein
MQTDLYITISGTWNLYCERIDQLYTVFARAKQLENQQELERINEFAVEIESLFLNFRGTLGAGPV